MDSRCTFESSPEVSDGGGGSTLAWSEQFKRWGAVALPSLRKQQEAIAAGSVQSVTGATITVRDDSDTATITAGWRVVAKGRTWNIRQIAPSERNGYLRMSVESGVAT